MATRTRRLWGPTTVTAAAVTLFTVPADRTALLKQITVYNGPALQVQVILYLNAVAAGNVLDALNAAGGGATRFTTQFDVLHPGESLLAVGPGTSVVMSGFGALLFGAPA